MACNKLCGKFRVKKPTGMGRYAAGQVHCQTCDIWMDYKGCNLKDGSPAKKDSVGMFCNCCNYRVRANPRNRIYKEKLRVDSKNEDVVKSTSSSKPKNLIDSSTSVKPKKKESESNIENMQSTDEESLMIIRAEITIITGRLNRQTKKLKLFENSELSKSIDEHPLVEVLCSYFQVAKNIGFIPSLGEYEESEYARFGRHNFPSAMSAEKGALVKKIWSVDLAEHVFRIFRFWDEHYNPARKIADEIMIPEQCQLLVTNYKKRKILDEHKVELYDDLINAYTDYRSLREIVLVTGIDEIKLRKEFRNLIRVPSKLRDYVNDGKLSFDPILSSEIALHATDYYKWDGEKGSSKKIEEKIFQMAVSMAKWFSESQNLEMKKVFYAKNDDYDKPASASAAKSNRIKKICEEYPVPDNQIPWKWSDRTGKQYMVIVYYMKNPEVTEFVRRWEYENGRRISKQWASQLIDDPEKFLEEHRNEFN